MIIKSRNSILLTLSFIMLTFIGCRKQYFGLLFAGGFNKDKIEIEYDNRLILDTILSTDYSTVVAHKLALERQKNKFLNIAVNDSIFTAIIIDKDIELIIIELSSNKLMLTKSDKIKTPRY